MLTVRAGAVLVIVGAAFALTGCDSQAHFTKDELDQLNHRTHVSMPVGAGATLARAQAAGKNLYEERLKEHAGDGSSAERNFGRPATPAPPERGKEK